MEYLEDPPLENPADMPCPKGNHNEALCTGTLEKHCTWTGWAMGFGVCTLNMANVEWTFDRLTRTEKADFVVPIRTLLLSVCRDSEQLKRFALDAITAYDTSQISYGDLMAMFYTAAPRLMPYGVHPTDEEILAVWRTSAILKMPLAGSGGKIALAQALHDRSASVMGQMTSALVSWALKHSLKMLDSQLKAKRSPYGGQTDTTAVGHLVGHLDPDRHGLAIYASGPAHGALSRFNVTGADSIPVPVQLDSMFEMVQNKDGVHELVSPKGKG